jgi:hypothetical protein
LGLVEAALSLSLDEERNGNHQQFGGSSGLQLEDGLRESLAEDGLRHAAAAIKFQQVQHLAHLVVIGGKRHGASEGRRGEPALRTLGCAHGSGEAGGLHAERIAAAGAKDVLRGGCAGPQPGYAALTHASPAQPDQRSVAQGAVRGQNSVGDVRSDGVHRGAEDGATSEHTRNRAPSCLACVPARRTAIPELGHLHAVAEDRTSLAAQQEKRQLCRWLQYSVSVAFFQWVYFQRNNGSTSKGI